MPQQTDLCSYLSLLQNQPSLLGADHFLHLSSMGLAPICANQPKGTTNTHTHIQLNHLCIVLITQQEYKYWKFRQKHPADNNRYAHTHMITIGMHTHTHKHTVQEGPTSVTLVTTQLVNWGDWLHTLFSHIAQSTHTQTRALFTHTVLLH